MIGCRVLAGYGDSVVVMVSWESYQYVGKF